MCLRESSLPCTHNPLVITVSDATRWVRSAPSVHRLFLHPAMIYPPHSCLVSSNKLKNFSEGLSVIPIGLETWLKDARCLLQGKELAGGAAVTRDVCLRYNANDLHYSSPPMHDVNFTRFACFLQGVAFCVTSSVEPIPQETGIISRRLSTE
ncbi:hypothetical protein TNCV_3226741 [Trichonephila clavipes]|nr:hypothetical protein TNCV_3226741 [Trichonephila clavipes]